MFHGNAHTIQFFVLNMFFALKHGLLQTNMLSSTLQRSTGNRQHATLLFGHRRADATIGDFSGLSVGQQTQQAFVNILVGGQYLALVDHGVPAGKVRTDAT